MMKGALKHLESIMTYPDISKKILGAVAKGSLIPSTPEDGWYDCNDINTMELSKVTGRFHWCTPRMYHPEGVDMVLIKNNKIVAGMFLLDAFSIAVRAERLRR